MKFTILILTLTLCINLHATTYYVSNLGNDANNGTSISTPWKTIGKVNSFFSSLQPGDQVLFNSGETFYGTITVSKSGTASNPIYIGAYGENIAKPVITSLKDITNWTNVGGNIWKSTDPDLAGISNLKIVLVNGRLQRMGRWPNYNPVTEGYNIIDAVTLGAGTSASPDVLTDAALPASPNWTGATLVAKTSSISTDNLPIYKHSGSTISTAKAENGYRVKPRFGYFIQNSLSTLDIQNEWYFKNSTHEFYIYSTSQPTGVQVATANNLAFATNKSYIIFEGLSFQGSNDNTVLFGSGTRVVFNNNDVAYTGTVSINMVNSSSCRIDNCNVSYSLGGMVRAGTGARDTITNSNFHWNELYDGMGLNGPGGSALSFNGKHCLFQYNNIDSVSFIAIKYPDDSAKVYNNFINSYCMLKTDGGALYNEGESDGHGGAVPHSGVKIIGNIIINGIGTLNGLPDINKNVHGIYCDGWANNQEIYNNIILNSPRSSIYFNNNHHMTAIGNILFNDKLHNMFIRYDGNSSPVRGMVVKDNIFFSPATDGKLLQLQSTTNDFSQWFSVLDSNSYCRPLNEPSGATSGTGSTFKTAIGSSAGAYYSLDKWQSAFPSFDRASRKTITTVSNPNDIRVEYNPTKTPVTITLDRTYIDQSANSYTTITLQPYAGVVLMANGGIITPPPPPPTNVIKIKYNRVIRII